MSMPNNSDFVQAAELAEREPVASEDSVARSFSVDASAPLEKFDPDIALADRLVAMRALRLPALKMYGIEDILLHIFLFPHRMSQFTSKPVLAKDYQQHLKLNSIELRKLASDYIHSLSNENFSRLTLDHLLIFPWFLLKQEKLIELESYVRIPEKINKVLIAKMPQAFFTEFLLRHSAFQQVLKGALLGLFEQKARHSDRNKEINSRYRAKRKKVSENIGDASLVVEDKTEGSVFSYEPNIPVSVPVQMPRVLVNMPACVPNSTMSAPGCYMPFFFPIQYSEFPIAYPWLLMQYPSMPPQMLVQPVRMDRPDEQVFPLQNAVVPPMVPAYTTYVGDHQQSIVAAQVPSRRSSTETAAYLLVDLRKKCD